MNGVKIFRNFISPKDQQLIEEKIKLPHWKYFHLSNPGSNETPFWSMDDLHHDDFFGIYLLNKVKQIIGDNHVVERIYMNGHTSGSCGYLHRDSEVSNSRTFLVYCNRTWHSNFGGSTYFVNGNEREYVYPEPYSAVCFQGNISHGSQPLSTDFKGLRVSLAFKLLKI
jgi:hypothetical protein